MHAGERDLLEAGRLSDEPPGRRGEARLLPRPRVDGMMHEQRSSHPVCTLSVKAVRRDAGLMAAPHGPSPPLKPGRRSMLRRGRAVWISSRSKSPAERSAIPSAPRTSGRIAAGTTIFAAGFSRAMRWIAWRAPWSAARGHGAGIDDHDVRERGIHAPAPRAWSCSSSRSESA